MSCLRHLFLLLIALWLPIQSVVAYAMPVCGHGEGGHSVIVHGMSRDITPAMAGHGHSQHEAVAHAAHAAGQDGQGPLSASANCDQCSVCHLACASFLGSAAGQMMWPLVDHIQHASAPHAVTFPYLARFDRPPSRAA